MERLIFRSTITALVLIVLASALPTASADGGDLDFGWCEL